MKPKNFKTKLHLITENNIKTKSVFNNIFFSDGKVFVSDRQHILLTQSLKIHGFDDYEIEQINGKHISNETFIEILKFKFITVENGHFICYNNNFTKKTKYTLIENGDMMPNFNNALTDISHNQNKIYQINANGKFLSKAISVLFEPTKMFLDFNKIQNTIAIRSSDYSWSDEIIIIMKRHE